MECGAEEIAIAEKILDQMLAADKARDYDAWLEESQVCLERHL